MYMIKFQNGDKVQYVGRKLASELSGKLGVVVARVGGTDNGVVVEFGGRDAYIMDETQHLARFQGKEPSPHLDGDKVSTGKADKKVAGPEVERRKGVGGGKRRNADQD